MQSRDREGALAFTRAKYETVFMKRCTKLTKLDMAKSEDRSSAPETDAVPKKNQGPAGLFLLSDDLPRCLRLTRCSLL